MKFRFAACVIALAGTCAAACGQTLAAAPDDPTDGGPTSDGGETSDAPDAATCSTTIRDDFDRADPVDDNWTPIVDRGEISSYMGTAFSSATNEKGGLLDRREAVLTRDLPSVPKTLKCSFKMRIDTPPNSSHVDAFSVLLTAPDGSISRIRLRVQHEGIGLREDFFRAADGGCDCPRGSERNATTEIQTFAWTQVTFSTTDFESFLATAGDTTVSFTPIESFVPTKVSLALGTVNFTDSEFAAQTFDELVCELGC